jgi:hypothetical protein
MVSNEWRNFKHAEVRLTKNLPEATKDNHKDLTRDLPTIKQNRDVLSCLTDKVQLLEKVSNYCYSSPEANWTAVKLETSIEKLNVA